MKIGITGASGFLGSYTLQYLSKLSKYELRALARTALPQELDSLSNVQWLYGDLSSPMTCQDFIDGLDCIIHLAHTHTPLSSNRDLVSDASLNIIPTLNLLQTIRESGKVPRFIYASSGGAIYQYNPHQRPYQESDLCIPNSSYGVQKLCAEAYLRLAADKQWLTAVSLRISNPYGVLLPPERLQGLIGVCLHQLRNQKPIRIYGNPDNVRDYIHLEDMCRAIEVAIQAETSFEVVNIGSGVGYSVNQVLDLLEQLIGKPLVKEYWQPPGNPQELVSWTVLDITKAKEVLDWQPHITLEQGLAKLCREELNLK
ncbi:NAD-dependent epimerase/dehydratase family protein [Tumidithrix elongata RA019]|uniref:NAD-dependent epimerase/dehydratase family protein n=1 Tax=Tumidithrix elongata BACA0141 TaxID=2716417 RepID=A0AAW9PQ45_9CYAN|nr:NAD-dependent epimerase/dehydratase family protein [Tumidithrix elongata RA019]